MPEVGRGELYLGGRVDEAGERTGEPLLYASERFTTHGVIVGMTGSGKTGLGVVLLEEALLAGVPALILDPKGDMGNLLLNFPALRPEDFAPWVDPAEARRREVTVDALAEATAERWAQGLAGWEVGPDRMRRLGLGAHFTLFTPGSTAGVPMNLVGSLAAPGLDWASHAETLRDEIESFVSSLLALAGERADPLSSPGHILLANLVEKAWRAGRDLDLPTLVGQVQRPPIRKLGVFDLDTFFPEKDRMALALKLNGLLASPAFAAWSEGPPVNPDALLRAPDGRPRASIVSLAHLTDSERQFVVTLLLSKVVTWMRRQPGTSDLRALIYMDEVFGFAPPTAEPPAKKPILTILKQARAHGVGMVLSTQNPVDLDYKAMSNAGTWMIGRLQTERDKARIVEALRSASGGVDVDAYDARIGGLGKRRFLLHSTKASGPTLFTTRWAMSFLRGPLSRAEIQRLTADAPEREAATASPTAGADAPSLAADESPVAPEVADGVPVHHVDPAARWLEAVGGDPGGARLEAALALRVSLRFDERKADLDHRMTWEAVIFPLEATLDPGAAQVVDWDPRDLRDDPPKGAVYALPEAPVGTKGFFRDVASEVRDALYRERTVTLPVNPALKLYGAMGETEAAFAARCEAQAEAGMDEDAAKLRGRFEARIDKQRDKIADAERRIRELETDLSTRRQNELWQGAGAVLNMFLRGRASTRGLSGAISRRGVTSRTKERLESAAERHGERVDELEELEAELVEALEALEEEWAQKARARDVLEVGLEKSDIDVEEVALVWVPVRIAGR